jgi:serine protease AprX
MTPRLLILLTGAAAAALAGSDKIARDLPRSGGPVPIIVQYRSAPSAGDLRDLAARGGRTTRTLRRIQAVAAELPPAQLERLAESANVSYISPDRSIRSALDFAAAAAGADIARQYGYTGAGVAIAVIDSGIADHPDLTDPATGRSRILYRESFTGPPSDRYGHGTHVAGVAAGSGAASGGPLHGIAPQASLVDLQALDAFGAGTDSSVVAAIERAIDLKDVYLIRVVNLSLGRPVV